MSNQSTFSLRRSVYAPQIKKAIQQRSRLRNDSPDIFEWLSSHFFRHIVGNLSSEREGVSLVDSLDKAKVLFQPQVCPDWVLDRFKKKQAGQQNINTNKNLNSNLNTNSNLKPNTNAPIWWIDPECEAVLELEARLLEFLSSRQGTVLEGKLLRINCPQALALWTAEHSAFAAEQALGRAKHQPEAVCVLWHGEQGVFVEFKADHPNLRQEMAYESQKMRHCLGQFANRQQFSGGYGEHYAKACESGELRLFSYRTGQDQAQPHITISAVVEKNGQLRIDQIKGKQNRPPIARYQNEVQQFLNTLPTQIHTPPDALKMGLVRSRPKWCLVSEVVDEADQIQLIHAHPFLVSDLPKPSHLVQWFVLAQQPDLLKDLAVSPAVRRILDANL